MLQSDFERFRDLMRGMGRVFNSEPDALVLDVYWISLRDWSIADFEKAVAHLMSTAQFMPRPADFTKLRKAGELTAHEAWAKVLSGAKLDANSRSLRAANLVGGQHAIRMANVDHDLPHIQRRFLEAYEQLSEVEPVRESLPQIAKQADGLLPRAGEKRKAGLLAVLP
jgi:hypothetical protein